MLRKTDLLQILQSLEFTIHSVEEERHLALNDLTIDELEEELEMWRDLAQRVSDASELEE